MIEAATPIKPKKGAGGVAEYSYTTVAEEDRGNRSRLYTAGRERKTQGSETFSRGEWVRWGRLILCAVVFLIEAGFYFLNNLGIIYLGNYCPFFSYGGTGTIVTYILMGILLSICRYQNVAPERKTAGPLFGIRRPAERMKEQI